MGIGSVSLSIIRTGVTAMFDAMGSTFPKAAVAAMEDKSQSKVHLAKQCLIDEGPEVFWKTIVGSLFVKTMRTIAPSVPEQFANLPGEMLGAGLHWWSASHQSKNRETQHATDSKEDKKPAFIEEFFNTCIKSPLGFALKAVGLDSNENNVSFLRFGAVQAALLAGGAYVLQGAEEENIPGMNLHYEDPWYISLFKTAGYTAFEQIAHLTSQTMRYYIDYKKEFGGKSKVFSKNVLAKALANVIHERTFPGNIPSAISGCLSTLFLGRYIPKPLAGAIGEAPMKGLERLLTVHLRRSTKDRYDENAADKRAANYRGHDKNWFNNILSFSDSVFNPVRNFLIEKVVAKIFKPDSMNINEYITELKDSFNIKLDGLKAKAKNKAA